MADVINLNKARKTRNKDQARSRAIENRAKFGQTKAEKDVARRETEARDRSIEGHKRERPED